MRSKREEAKKLLEQGIDPGAQRQAVKAAVRADNEHAYEVIAREWFAKQAPGWSESNRERVLARQENDIFPLLGSRPISQVTAPELLAALRRIEGRGAVDTAHRALQDCSRIFRYAVATGRAERDPAADLRGALAPARSSSFARIKEPQALGQLLRDIDAYSGNLIARGAAAAPLYLCEPEGSPARRMGGVQLSPGAGARPSSSGWSAVPCTAQAASHLATSSKSRIRGSQCACARLAIAPRKAASAINSWLIIPGWGRRLSPTSIKNAGKWSCSSMIGG